MAEILHLSSKLVSSHILSRCVTFLILLAAVTFVQGGFYAGNCPDEAAAESKVSLSCQLDCRFAHNSLEGHCGDEDYEDYNCYCGDPLTTPSPRPLQCVNETNEKYEDLCRIDCLCNHASLYWECNYETFTCHCWGENSEPDKNDNCPYECLRDMVVDLNAFELPGVKFGVPPNCNIEKNSSE